MTNSLPPLPPVIALGRNEIGIIAESEGMRYYLTECCAASAKGSGEGVVCRACYQYIDERLGGLPAQSGPVPVPFGDGVPHVALLAILKGVSA